MFNVKLFSKNKFFISMRLKLSILKILLKKSILKSKKIIKIKKTKKNKQKEVIIFKLIENLNISLDAIDVMYINKINMPPRKIKNREYENQKDLVNNPVKRAIEIVWIISKIPIDNGWFINEKENEEIIKKKNIKFCIISDQKIVYEKY